MNVEAGDASFVLKGNNNSVDCASIAAAPIVEYLEEGEAYLVTIVVDSQSGQLALKAVRLLFTDMCMHISERSSGAAKRPPEL